ncbi:hypothetical protein GRAN_2114 [Granulicella sibirica]|uniref:Uncharacterized protein n=1 Tax=Granulicella sibirica TaxID=2479048 RepID=A0A4V1L6C7_9BACT|nr:hypothetical protein GRAN_2114 [Granulicella sibirica]
MPLPSKKRDPLKTRHLALAAERRRQVRGLLVLAFVILVASILRAGVPRVFTLGWWRLW